MQFLVAVAPHMAEWHTECADEASSTGGFADIPEVPDLIRLGQLGKW